MPGGGRLTVSLERRGEMADIEIEDTGRGIAPEHRQRIFQLFFTTRPGGSGIGLASTFRTVQLHNGSIDFKSEVGRGTTFRIELPLARQMEPALLASARSGRGGSAEYVMRKAEFLVLLCAAALGAAGCASKHIVRAAPPSVSTPPPEETEPMPPPATPPPVETNDRTASGSPLPRPRRPRRPNVPRPRVRVRHRRKPPNPRLPNRRRRRFRRNSPPRTSKRRRPIRLRTSQRPKRTCSRPTAEQLNAAQKDLTEKISGFLGQAHEAIRRR